MNVKKFKADVTAAAAHFRGVAVGVLDICNGESEGEVVVTFQHPHLSSPIHIQAVAQSLSKYPRGNSYMLFTTSPDVPNIVIDALVRVKDYLFGARVMGVVTILAKSLNAALEPSSDSLEAILEDYKSWDDKEDQEDKESTENVDNDDAADDDADNDADNDGSFEDFSDDDFGDFGDFSESNFKDSNFEDSSDDENFGLNSRPSSPQREDLLPRMKHDLREVRAAGYKIGLLDGLGRHADDGIISIARRVNQLELSEDALKAWDIRDANYVVLLIRYEGHYLPLETLLEHPVPGSRVQFRIGICNQYKPSTSSALAAVADLFHATTSKVGAHHATTSKTPSSKARDQPSKAEGGDFQNMFLSKSLDTFMGESLVPLLKLRETMDLSWDGANETLIANRALSFEPRPRQPPGTQPQPQGSGQGMEQRKALGSVLPKEKAEDEFTVLVSDHLSESATQERSLPLVAMQFAMHYFVRCPEFCLRCHRRLDDKFDAIMPYVCSNSLCLFQYLTMGLGPNVENDIIRKPVVVDLLISLFYASIQRRDQLARLKKHEDPAIRDYPVGLQLRVPALFSPEVALHKPIKVKVTADPTVFLVEQAGDLGRLFVSQWVAFQRSGDNIDSKERISHALIIGVDHDKLSVTMQVMSHSSSHLSIPSYTKDGEVELYPYELDCDVLDDSSKSSAMSLLLGTLPSIRAIRSYLTSHPHVTFRSYSRLSPAAATLLQWIISSNRSCIQEIDSSRAERISGMGPWIQFRFLSDKEVRFSRALQQVAASGKLGATPTIFAWHGSPLENWHSILRNGLNYRDTRHGRAHGHGVYFSDRFNVSTLYTNEHDRTWPNSEINMSSAVSLNEIINSPQGFLCQKPCYVIPQLDWHQCRYLFVRSNRLDSQGDADDPPPNVPILEQAPGLEVTGPENSHIQIPVAAMPLRSVPALGQTWSRKTVVRSLAEHSEDEDSEDLEFIMDEEKQPTSEDQQAHESSAKTALTGFKPGDLDLATLPRLEPPAWATATATRVMGREVKRLQKLQAGTPLHELGWYIDFDKLTNMFQWIVQFHSFDLALPLARDMEEAGVTSVVMEVRFGKEHPLTPPFIRVVRPRFLPFLQGGGGHVTAGGAMCMELLTNTGWTPANSMESVLLQVRMALCNLDPQPARLNQDIGRGDQNEDYGMGEAIEAYVRAARAHGWEVPRGLMASIGYPR